MNRSTILALLIGLLLAGGIYLLLHKDAPQAGEDAPQAGEDAPQAGEDAPPAQEDPAGGSAQDSAIANLLRDTEELVPPAYDEEAMRALAEQAGARMTRAQEEVVLPLLHRHALALRKNLEGARAALQQDPEADLSRYVMFSSQAHAHFQRAVRGVVSDETARALFEAVPPMVPALPADEPAPPASGEK